jgi:hypothetical protein
LHLQGTLAECSRDREGLLARRYGAVVVSRYTERMGHPGQHPSQPGPLVKRSGQDLGLAQYGEVSLILSQCGQRAIQSEAELEGHHPGVTGFGQVCEGLEGMLEGG